MFTFTPLVGAQSASTASSSLLEFDNGVKVLIDVGWDSSFDCAKLEAIQKHTSTLSIVLLTHATIEHIGAYAHCCKNVAGFNQIPVYATTPVVNLGRTLTIDLYKSAGAAASLLSTNTLNSAIAKSSTPQILLPLPASEEIGNYFSRIYPLKYSQPHQPVPSPFSPPLAGLTITAYGAGHTLGGTIWHIQHGMESIVYAVDWNQTKENLFDGARMLEAGGQDIIEPLKRPTAFVCSSRGVERADVSPPRKRDEALIGLIRETIAQGGKVLLPTDSSARILELAYVLNSSWRANVDGPHGATFRSAKIYMATRSSKATLRYLQSMLEWLEPGVAQEGETAMTTKGGVHPLQWNHVKKVERKAQVDRALARRRPGVFLASGASLEWGFSRDALRAWASDPRNLIILTETASALGTSKNWLARQLWDFYQSKDGITASHGRIKIVNSDGQVFNSQEMSTADLSDAENTLYQQHLALQTRLHSSLQSGNTVDEAAGVIAGDDQADDSSDSEEEDEDTEHQGRALNLSLQMTQNKRKVGLTDAELGVNVLLRGKNVYDYDVRGKRGREKMFPFVAHRTRSDEFGDVIKAEDYLRAEEREEAEGISVRVGDNNVGAIGAGEKRKWDDADSSKQHRNASRQAKKSKAETKLDDKKHEPDFVDEIIARATGESVNAAGQNAATNGDGLDEESSGSEEEDEEDESDYEPDADGPQKAIFTTIDLPLSLKIAHIDFSGLAALTDIVNIVSMMRPRKLIVAAGSSTETQVLAEKCRPILEMAKREILTPEVGETIEASMDTNAWMLKLSPELVRRLEWQITDRQGSDMRIASISGLLATPEAPKEGTGDENSTEEDGTQSKKLKLASGSSTMATRTNAPDDSAAPLPLLTVPPVVSIASAAAATAAHPVRVGDLRILDLRSHLISLGHEVVVRGLGTLLVDGSVVIRKIPSTGRLEVECANTGFARAPGRTMRLLAGADGVLRQVFDMRGVFFGVREEVERALAIVR